MVEIYNSREKPRGFSYIKSVDFERAIKKSFPFKETRDQKQAIKDVLHETKFAKPIYKKSYALLTNAEFGFLFSKHQEFFLLPRL